MGSQAGSQSLGSFEPSRDGCHASLSVPIAREGEIAAPKKLSDLTADQRVEFAKKKTQKLVDHTIGLITLHETNRIVVYSPQLSSQIPQSFAANAFNSFQRSLYGFGLVRLSALWIAPRDNDLDMESLPAVVDLIDRTDVLDILERETYLAHLSPIGIIGLEDMSPELRGRAKQEERAFIESWARQQSTKSKRKLKSAIAWTRRAGSSDKLKSVINHRDKFLAHSLSQTRAEKNGPVGPMMYGYERDLIWKTVAIVHRLHLGVNGAGFTWKDSVRIARKNAEALWLGCTFKVLK